MATSTVIFVILFVIINAEYIQPNIHTSYHIKGIPTLHNSPTNQKTVTSNWSTKVPFYPYYPTRTVQILDGNWYYGYGGSNFNLNQTINPSKFNSLT
eukprot:78974_1